MKTKIPQSKTCQFSSVAQSCPALCDPMDCSTSGFPVHHQHWSLFKLMSIMSVMPPKHLILCHPLFLLLSVFPSIRSFPTSQFFTSGGQSIGASASILPMNIQGWSPSGLIGFISLLSKGLSRVFSSPQFESISSLALSLLYDSTVTSIHDYWEKS